MSDDAEPASGVPLQGEITGLLKAWRAGDRGALDALVPLAYENLRRIAQGHLRRERPGHTLQPSAVVNEAYMRLAQGAPGEWKDRVHFFAVASRLMRQILVDHARRRAAQKRGAAGVSRIETVAMTAPRDVDVIAVDDALKKLAELDAQQAEIVEMRFFAGLKVEEVSEALDISAATVHRKWAAARAWLHRELMGSPP